MIFSKHLPSEQVFLHHDQLISEHAGTQNFKSVARIDVFPETYLSELSKLGMGKPAGIFQTAFFQTAFSKHCKFMKFDKIVHKYVNVRLQTTTDNIWCGREGPGEGERGQKMPQFCKGDPLRSSSKENLLTKIDAIKVLHVAHNLFVIFLLGTILV